MEKDMEFKNKVIVVTGAGGGVGRELVRQLVEKGASVAAVDINMKALEETRERAGDLYSRVSLHLVDITDRERVSRLPGEIVDYHGRVDGLINNAGIIQPFLTLANLSGEQIDRLMNINFFGMMNMTRALLPRLAERRRPASAMYPAWADSFPCRARLSTALPRRR